MAAAITLATRGRGLSTPNPNVGCVIVNAGRMVARGWTQGGGRPHAEGMALDLAGQAARGATAYVTLEPCAHESARGPSCTDALIAAGVARVVAATRDPDPRTNGQGMARLEAAGIAVTHGVLADAARDAMAGWWTRASLGRPHVTLKLATSLDGCIAMADGTSRWITGERSRAHAHLLRARSDAILVGRGTWEADDPSLDVRLSGLENRSPQRLMLTHGPSSEGRKASTLPDGWTALSSPGGITELAGINDLLIEGGAGAASAFLAADLVDTLVLYRAPILLGGGRSALNDIGLAALNVAHGRWRLADARVLGQDHVETYQRVRES
ncbi:MAG: bifunctional diaminohydroxyphosphoribosylaminopyrimidine deaminase/5-amino-6-(5-phosphoribosylamino)uracil reductase RibD [Sphingopyxis sp.]